MMRVSVVVPLFNKAPYAARCIESILKQDFPDFELIVVNDGSTDGSERIVANFSDPRVRLVNQANAGPGAARNRGMAEAEGEYIAFLDADDEWLPGYLQHSVRKLDDNPSAACTTCGYGESPGAADLSRFWRKRNIPDTLYRVNPGTPAQLLVHMVAYMLPCTTLSRVNILRNLGGFYEKEHCQYAEDAFLWVQVLLNHPVVFNFAPLVRIHRYAAELSKNLDGCRPVEPFLLRPDVLQASCPSELQDLLDRFICIRAFKTACVLGYWGDWRQARRIRGRFACVGAWRLPYFLPALVCSTAAGSRLGAASRKLRGG